MRKNKYTKRDKKIHNRKHGMRKDGNSVKLIQRIQVEKSERIKNDSRP
jgi:hypothetical protein